MNEDSIFKKATVADQHRRFSSRNFGPDLQARFSGNFLAVILGKVLDRCKNSDVFYGKTFATVLKSVSFKKAVEISITYKICTEFPHTIFVVIVFLYVRTSTFKAYNMIFYH